MDERMNDGKRRAYAIVDDALRTLPLQAAPPDLLGKVMEGIQSRGESKRRFSSPLCWWGAAGAAIALGLAWGLWSILPLDWPARLQFRLLVWRQHLSYAQPQVGLVLGILVMLTAGILLAGMVSWRAALNRNLES